MIDLITVQGQLISDNWLHWIDVEGTGIRLIMPEAT